MAINFDGTDDYLKKDNVNVFNDSSFSSTSYSFSFSCWVRPNGRHVGGVFEQYNPSPKSGNGRLGLWMLSNGKMRLRYHNSYVVTSAAHISTSTTTWYHLAGFWQHGERGLYVNGSSVASHTGNKNSDHSHAGVDFNIGRVYESAPGTARFFNGDIAEFAAWKVKLSDPEIAILADGFSPAFVRPSESLGYWPLGGAYSNYIDLVNQRTLTVESSPGESDHPRIIYPSGPATYDFAVPVVEEEEEPAAERGWMFESMQVGAATGGRRRLSPPDTRTASSFKGWAVESLQVGVSGGGARKK